MDYDWLILMACQLVKDHFMQAVKELQSLYIYINFFWEVAS